MVNFLRIVANFLGELIGKILNIPITSVFLPERPDHGVVSGLVTFGSLLFIVMILGLAIRFFRGGKGD